MVTGAHREDGQCRRHRIAAGRLSRRALVHIEDGGSARLEAQGAEIVVPI